MEPKKLEVARGSILIEWSDGHRSTYSHFVLRGQCPCAMCKGEPGIFGRYYASSQRPAVDPSVEPEEIESVGRYGIKIRWSDGHDLGIYSYDYLRELCECEECQKRNGKDIPHDSPMGSEGRPQG